MEKRKVVIGVAWTYANSDIHLGHISAYISGDVLARYHRAKGDDVALVSGTDCHGTPTTERAIRENTTPLEIVERYHKQYVEVFNKMGFSYDCYTLTASTYHHEKVKEMFTKLINNGFIFPKTEKASFCTKCNKFVYDREVEVVCPKCGGVSKGDQCGDCGYVFTNEDLLKSKCRICGSQTEIRENTNLYFDLPKLQKELQEHFENCKNNWRKNSVNETAKFLGEGLVERAVTRDLNWGIDVPFEGYDEKKIYVWIEAVWGYITATQKYCEENGLNWEDYWKNHHNGTNKIYMCHGKDNIVFHTIIFPALLLAMKEDFYLPDYCVAIEFLNAKGEKMSKSKGNGSTMKDMLEVYNPDTIRYLCIANGPEKKDTEFSTDIILALHNGEIVNKFANFVNRTLNYKGLDGVIPAGKIDPEIRKLVAQTYEKTSELIENICFKDALATVMGLVEEANKYYDTKQPWLLFKNEDKTEFNNVIATCAFVIANLSSLFNPFMPFSSQKIRDYLKIEDAIKWEVVEFEGGKNFGKFEPLFQRLNVKDFQ